MTKRERPKWRRAAYAFMDSPSSQRTDYLGWRYLQMARTRLERCFIEDHLDDLVGVVNTNG